MLTPWRRGEVALIAGICDNGDAIFNRDLLVRLPFIIFVFIALFSMAVSHTIFTTYGSRIGSPNSNLRT